MTFKFRHLVAALLLHVLLFAILAGGMQCSKQPVRPPVIRAVLLDPDRKEVQQQRRDEQKRLDEQKRREQEQKQREQEQQRRKLEQEQKQREAEEQKRKVAEQERIRKDAEAKKQKDLAEKKKADEQARLKKEQQEQKTRQEQARREMQEQMQREEELRREALSREMQREEQARAASERDLKLAQWQDTLRRHIEDKGRPPSAECTVRVQQLPDGTVTNAKIAKSCGNPALDKSVEDAVYRSSPLPRPADPSIFERDLIINIIPRS